MIHIYSIHSTFLGRMETTRLSRESLEPLRGHKAHPTDSVAHMAQGHPLNLVSCVISDLIAEKGFERIDEIELFEHCKDAGVYVAEPRQSALRARVR